LFVYVLIMRSELERTRAHVRQVLGKLRRTTRGTGIHWARRYAVARRNHGTDVKM
jgi:hypothetical protein